MIYLEGTGRRRKSEDNQVRENEDRLRGLESC